MLTRYGRTGASSRYRLMQYAPLFECTGNEVEVWPLLDDGYIRELYDNGRRAANILLTGYTRRMRQMLSIERFDAVICEQEAFPYFPDFLEQVFRRRTPKLFLDYDDAAYVRYQRNPLLKNKIAQLMASAEAVVVGNRYLAGYAQQFAKRVTLIPTVVDLARYPQRRRTIGVKIVRVVWIGTPITAGMLEPLLPVFERLQKRHARLVFRFIGAGDRLPGNALQSETPRWSEESETELLAECDLGIMPLPDTEFTRGKCGLKLIQYMACGLPVVASPIGVNREIVRHGHNGFLASSPAQWEEALSCLIADPDLRLRMGHAARERVESEYTLEHGFAKWMEVLAGGEVAPLRREMVAANSEKMAAAAN
jgi:glycosyltransferase involved in cell wall biosynthesis